MKVAVVFVLLFATVLCRPARKVPYSSSESSEELSIAAAAGPHGNTESSDEDKEAPVEVTSDVPDTASSSDTASVDSKDSEDSDDDDDDDDDDDETEESETEEDESSDSSESGESSTLAPTTVTPVIVTEGPVAETTLEPIEPTIVTDTDTARGDSLGGYHSEYKSIVYVEDKSYHKVPAPYKSYEFVDTGKKMAYDMTVDNEVEKSLPVYKALQVHSDILEEDTSTPEVENQGLDASSGISQDKDLSPPQDSLPEEESISTSDATTSESESASTASDSTSTSTSQDSEDEESQSSEEATANPGAADSDSDEIDSSESDSDEEGPVPDTTTDMPVVITAK